MASVNIRDLGPDFSWGARVEGVNWDNVHDEALGSDLKALFVDRGLIIFEGMETSPEMQVELSKVFGPLKEHPIKNIARTNTDLAEGVIDMHHVPMGERKNDHGLTEIDGRKVVNFLPWHFDHSYNDELNYAGVLRSVIPAAERGRTGFADGIDIYKKMDPEILKKIENLSGIYTLDLRLHHMRFGRFFKTFGDNAWEAAMTNESTTIPRAIHPMVWTRPTGEKVAHFCGFTAVGVEGHEDPEGEALFEEALQEMYRSIDAYWHDWKPTDLVIWDNHRVLHAVEGVDPKHERRMHRTTIKGDYGLGRFEGGKKVGEVKREVAPLELPD